VKTTIKLLIILFLTSCYHSPNLTPELTEFSRSAGMQKEINRLLERDADNKKLEKIYLEEIRLAEENNDQDAFKFYLSEYVKVERLKIPEWMKKEHNYVEGGVNVKY